MFPYIKWPEKRHWIWHHRRQILYPFKLWGSNTAQENGDMGKRTDNFWLYNILTMFDDSERSWAQSWQEEPVGQSSLTVGSCAWCVITSLNELRSRLRIHVDILRHKLFTCVHTITVRHQNPHKQCMFCAHTCTCAHTHTDTDTHTHMYLLLDWSQFVQLPQAELEE